MQVATVGRILERYGIVTAAVLPAEKGYRNECYPIQLGDGRCANLILYKSEPDILETIRRLHSVSNFVAARGLPVRVPLDRRIVRVYSARGSRYAALYNYLPGTTISWEAYTQKHLKLLGKTMSDLHATLAECSVAGLPFVATQYVAIYERMQRYFADQHVAEALQYKLGLRVRKKFIVDMLQLLDQCHRLSNQQVLHMDLVRSNVLFADSKNGLELTGILDFEKVALGHPLFDIARSLAFLLVDCKYKSEAQVRKYFLFSGYQKRGAKPLARVTVCTAGGRRPLLECLLDMFLLYDFYKFLRHNPYESLPQNEHFVRTRDLLLPRGVISTTHMV